MIFQGKSARTGPAGSAGSAGSADSAGPAGSAGLSPADSGSADSARTAASRRRPRRPRRRLVIGAAAVAAAGAALGLGVAFSGVASASTVLPSNCVAAPHACGFPDASNSGVQAGTTLLAVPGQISSGPGWAYNAASGTVKVTGTSASLTGLSIPYPVNITASNVTLNNVKVLVSGTSSAISLAHTSGVTIENCTISGSDAGVGRVGAAIVDAYGDSTGMLIKNNNISFFKTGVQITTGQITGNYIHDPGYVDGDHTNGIFDAGTTQPLSITNNTILDSLSQTDAISIDASVTGQVIANKTITGNLLAGGAYTIYAGTTLSNTTNHITITGNRFAQAYYTKAGFYGPAAYYDSSTPGAGNTWSGNTWDTTGQAIATP